MCKTPGTGRECKPLEDIPMDEEDDDPASEENSESLDSNSYYSSSSDEGGSESDAESTSGNRVTKDMVVLLMLKENNVISEDFYAEKAGNITDDIKSLIPKPPKSGPSSRADSVDALLDASSITDLLEEFLADKEKDQSDLIGSKGDAESHVGGGSKESLKGNEAVAKKAVVDEAGSGMRENDVTISTEEARKEQSNGDMSGMSEQEAVTDSNQKESKKVETTSLQQQASVETKRGRDDLRGNTQTDISEDTECANVETPHLISETNKAIRKTLESMIDVVNECEQAAEVCSVFAQQTYNSVCGFNSELDKSLPRNCNKRKRDNSKKERKPMRQLDPNKQTMSFEGILKKLVQEKRISTDYEYVAVLETYVKGLDKHYGKNRAVDKFDEPTEDLREFALFLNYYSPSSYKYIIESFNTPLPEHKVLCSWYMQVNDRPGLSGRAFDILKQKASKKRLTCVLMSCDVFLTNYGLNYDQVNYGGGCNYEYTDKATIVYVFVLVSLDEDWKMPIGYIFAKSIPAESQAELIRVCLTQCDEAGVDVVAVTVDTATPAEFLGCSLEDPKNLKTTFKHPTCDRNVAVWIDPCLALRSARHTLKVKEVLKDSAGAKIRWNLIRKLRKLQSDETIDFDKSEFLKLRNHIAKVGLTTETFSDSLAPALELCEELLPDTFDNTAPTRKYIEIINNFYDILHSRTTTDIDDVMNRLNPAKEYIVGLFCNEANKLSSHDKINLFPNQKLFRLRSFVDGQPICGFIGFLICIESFKHLHATLVEKEQRMNFLNMHRLCKDHADDFVKDLRAHTRLQPDDYNGWSFQCYYSHIFEVLEKNPRLSDQTFSLGQWRLKNKYPPAVTIKLTSGKRAWDEFYSFQYKPKKLPKTLHENRATNLVRAYSKAMDTEMDVSVRKNMVGYLAGWIAARFARRLKCETCIDALCSDKKLWFHKFITFKHLKGVCLPSEEIFLICWECEKALRQKTSPAKLRVWVLRRLLQGFPWSKQTRHHPIHHILLARAVIAKYIPLRVSAPFFNKDNQRILDFYRLFACMGSCVFEQLDNMGSLIRNEAESTELMDVL